MAKRRRKLSSDHEKQLIKSSQEVELILAKIYDINEDDIREEYIEAFALAKMLLDNLKKEYKLIGYTDQSDSLLEQYSLALNKFKSEFEI